MTDGSYKAPIKLWQNTDQKIFKVEYLIKLSQYFGNFAKAVIRSYNKTFFRKVSKILAEFDKLFNFEKFLIYALPNLIETLYVLVVMYIS